MKLAGAEASRFLAKPDPNRAGLLIFGADTMRVALKRQEAILALIGPDGEAEMRLTRIQAADLRKDAALLNDATRAVGFFPGPRVAFVEDATDGLTATLEAALKDWRAGDAQIVVTAGNLTGKSALKTLFAAAALGLLASAAQAQGPTCNAAAAEKKLAGAAKNSFLKKCEKDAAGSASAVCLNKAAEKKLAGAAKNSFVKKCEKDAAAAPQ